MEKQRDKAAKRIQRKLEKQSGVQTDESTEEELFAGGEGDEFAPESPETPESPDIREDSSDPR